MARNGQGNRGRGHGRVAAIAALALGAAGLQPVAHAQSTKEAVFNFLKEVGCSQLPFGTCDALDPENARNIGLTYKALLVNKYCGTGNFNAAQQLLDADSALEPEACRQALAIR